MLMSTIKQIVKIDEEQANQQARASQTIKEDCDRELAKAIPILDAAVAALNTLTNNVK